MLKNYMLYDPSRWRIYMGDTHGDGTPAAAAADIACCTKQKYKDPLHLHCGGDRGVRYSCSSGEKVYMALVPFMP